MIQDGQAKATDLIDIIQQASMKTSEIENEDGTVTSQQIIDPETVWWKTLSVASSSFGRFAYELKEWERNAFEASINMTDERAKDIAHQIIEVGTSFRRSIDAKSSESIMGKDHAQSTLIDKINKNKVEKVHTFRGEMKRSAIDMFLGREAEREADED